MNPCDQCGKREAVFTFTVVGADGQHRQSSLCRDCAEKKGLLDKKLSIAEIFSEFLKEKVETGARPLVCPDCSLTYAEFKQGGRLGCGRCYAAFQPALTELIRRIQGSTRHRGKIPAPGEKTSDVEQRVRRLRQALDQAIALEDFEKAATIRNQLDQYDAQRN